MLDCFLDIFNTHLPLHLIQHLKNFWLKHMSIKMWTHQYFKKFSSGSCDYLNLN